MVNPGASKLSLQWYQNSKSTVMNWFLLFIE